MIADCEDIKLLTENWKRDHMHSLTKARTRDAETDHPRKRDPKLASPVTLHPSDWLNDGLNESKDFCRLCINLWLKPQFAQVVGLFSST